jgi:hypothetical protein
MLLLLHFFDLQVIVMLFMTMDSIQINYYFVKLLYSETSIHRSRMHCFHFLWSLYIAHINNFTATIVFPLSSFIFRGPFIKDG